MATVERMICYFHEHNVPYNLVWSRGSDIIDGTVVTRLIRCYIWPRASGEGLTPHPAFDNACAELDGHLPIKTRDSFDQLTGDWAYRIRGLIKFILVIQFIKLKRHNHDEKLNPLKSRLRTSSLNPNLLDEICSVFSKF